MTAVELDASWALGDKLHGGYLLRTLVGPVLNPDHPHPLSVSAHFLSSPAPGPASVEVTVLRTGRRVATSRAQLVQDGRVCVEALVATGTLGPAAAYWRDPSGRPELVPVEQCLRVEPDRPGEMRLGHMGHVDLRLDLASYAVPAARVAGWLTMAGQDPADPLDALDLLVLADAMPPVTFGIGLSGWVPTVELTVHVRSLPAPGRLRGVQQARLLQDGWLDEDCDLWDGDGNLVVQARQLAGYRLP